uniref:Retrotransposon gag domain-containing protein n=1 Tax=Brassica oleracea var. oleracea TaxID=109376 RepID=A0A0D3CE21_BRAOL
YTSSAPVQHDKHPTFVTTSVTCSAVTTQAADSDALNIEFIDIKVISTAQTDTTLTEVMRRYQEETLKKKKKKLKYSYRTRGCQTEGLGMVHDEVAQINVGIDARFRGMEEFFKQMLADAVTSIREGGSSTPQGDVQLGRAQPSMSVNREIGEGNNLVAPTAQHRNIKLVFPKFQHGDPTAWISKAKQYFAYQNMPHVQRVSFASYHLENEANEWWQATSKALEEEQIVIT